MPAVLSLTIRDPDDGPDPVPHRSPTDSERFGELPLGRQPVPRLQLAAVESMLDLSDDLLVRAQSREGLPLGWRWLRHVYL